MAIKVRITARANTITKEKLVSANVVDLRVVKYPEFCEYLAQDSTVGVADVAAVMAQLEKKLPLLLSMGNKVQISQGGMTVKPTVSGSLSQSQLKAKLQARKDAGETVNVDRALTSADLTVNDLTAGVTIDFGKKFKSSFADKAEFQRVQSGVVEEDASSDVVVGEDSDGHPTVE